MDEKKQERLRLWQGRLADNEQEYQRELDRMDRREDLYRGDRKLRPMTDNDSSAAKGLETPHVRNIIAENIESQISSAIPQPKVTARRKEDEGKAKLIEDWLRNELDRLPMEILNDQQERTVPIQGGGFYHIEWDNSRRTHSTVGETVISLRHPKQVIPQAGVYTSMEDMDYFILKIPTTREAIRRRYGVEVEDQGELEPEIRGSMGESPAPDMVTRYMAIYRNETGGVGLFSWCNDQALEDLEDSQARRLRRCAQCGAVEPEEGTEVVRQQELVTPDPMAAALGAGAETVEQVEVWHRGDPCPYCGGRHWQDQEEAYQEIWDPIVRDGVEIVPGAREVWDQETGELRYEPTKIPYYKPDLYPVVLQRNVSIFGQLLGDSDVDKMADQQNTVNRLEKKIIDRIITAGSRIIMPGTGRHRIDTRDSEVWYVEGVQDASMIQVKDFTGNLQYELAYLAQAYEEARQITGITDSFQGRADSTATSGKAKEFAAAQSAGRMESKRRMKEAAYADLFRLMFLFTLAYADEPRAVVSQDSKGNRTYGEFCKWDFLERDEAGEWYWNTDFLFSCDSSAPLAQNRERMWQETIQLFSAGCFGNPQELETLIALWTKLEMLHYPGAVDTRGYLEEKLEQQRAMMAQQQAMQQQAVAQQQAAGQGGVPQELMAAIDARAREAARRDAGF